ncbi:MAG: helix-turn-helix domain-containing protein [Alphaproteobacteria bacterium]|jgi:AcrR family transcriptional regulator|nr:helix-turn-helix domain-containing protein [Alphaproteobacteria bacterium]MDP6563977.1 helix-turn-helix domain-containing protein [Alphaproteobacteria bacterium]MDP6814725.1 helix-turn-helix domain-containing protein [Alphaproteobacteria bacterium]
MANAKTREKLILSAERLIALRGTEGVSLREINRAAGQRNASALHYHFGSRQGLLEAVFEFRMERTNQRRNELVDTIEADGVTGDLYRLCEASVLPLAEMLDANGAGHYIPFLAQVTADPLIRNSEVIVRERWSGVRRLNRHILALLAQLPQRIALQRLTMSQGLVIYQLAEHQRQLNSAEAPAAAETALFVSDLIDLKMATLRAPVSPRTLAGLADLDRADG